VDAVRHLLAIFRNRAQRHGCRCVVAGWNNRVPAHAASRWKRGRRTRDRSEVCSCAARYLPDQRPCRDFAGNARQLHADILVARSSIVVARACRGDAGAPRSNRAAVQDIGRYAKTSGPALVPGFRLCGAIGAFRQHRVDGVPWRTNLDVRLASILSADERQRLDDALGSQDSGALGPLDAIETALPILSADPDRTSLVHEAISIARSELRSSGAIRTEPMTGSATCGSSGCHEQIYDEWVPSAHGFAAIDILFRDVQEILAEAQGSAETRSCAGCHDPVALLAGSRDGAWIAGDDLVIHEGNSCLVCHSISSTDTEGNGGYTIKVPQRYLFAGEEGAGSFWNRFLIRSYPSHHIASFKRPIYKESEFCAACHKQTKLASSETAIGLAQEQNEYDSWRQGHWYYEDDPDRTLGCRDCHMPLVDSSDPARGDSVDANRSAGDGKHRSHRTLGSNSYIPVVQGLPGGEFQAAKITAWLKGAIEIDEIADRWTDGPVVDLSIIAPDVIEPGELVNLTLVMHNNKTGHDFPAGPLDLLASWIEIKVEDDQGRILMHRGDPEGDKPTLDAPIVYKADWYDKQGLPVERHNIWEVVGASYKRSLQSGDVDVVDVPFRCPVIARPRISDSISEDGPGERKSDVVFAVEGESARELTITARVLYRKANPEFLANIYSLDTRVEAPIIEMNRVTHKIRVNYGE